MSKIPARIVAVLVVLSLVYAAPALATPQRPTNDLHASSLVYVVTEWMTEVWPVLCRSRSPQTSPRPNSTIDALGSDADPNGEPRIATSTPPVQGELGSDADPDG